MRSWASGQKRKMRTVLATFSGTKTVQMMIGWRSSPAPLWRIPGDISPLSALSLCPQSVGNGNGFAISLEKRFHPGSVLGSMGGTVGWSLLHNEKRNSEMWIRTLEGSVFDWQVSPVFLYLDVLVFGWILSLLVIWNLFFSLITCDCHSPGEDHRISKLCVSTRRAGTAPGPGSYVRMLRRTFLLHLYTSWHNRCITSSWNEVCLTGVLTLLFSWVRLLCVSQHACKTLQTYVWMLLTLLHSDSDGAPIPDM